MSEHRAETIALCGGHFLHTTSARDVAGPDRAFPTLRDAVTA